MQLEGRIALSLYDDARPGQAPDRQFSSAFLLQGSAEAGQMQLISPLGSVLAVLEWSPDRARLRRGPETHDFASLDALLHEVTGAALPARALLTWLRGDPAPVDGWSVDLSAHPRGRIQAQRTHPMPRAELRVIFD
ncbi:MAG: hypothetical protein RLZZ126_746 [Pseudomonadota bacterium]